MTDHSELIERLEKLPSSISPAIRESAQALRNADANYQRINKSRNHWIDQHMKVDIENEKLQARVDELESALQQVVVHGVWNECEYCNAKVKIAEQALATEDDDQG